MRFVTLVLSSLTLSSVSYGLTPDKQMTQDEYVAIWSNVAVEQMTIHRIPASITLAQGLLESGNGNSVLAVEGNNHFGIKCSNWTGETIHVDDDIKNECFRKYPNATESYMDHSIFLKKPRYASLFTLKIDDYKGWATGLKAAGYATHPQYASKLIDLIERLKLDQYDEKTTTVDANKEIAAAIKEEKKATDAKTQSSTSTAKTQTKQEVTETQAVSTSAAAASSAPKTIAIDEASLEYKAHQVYEHKNDVSYIVARKGDTYYKIAKEFQLGTWQLYKYNDFAETKDMLAPGDVVYIDPKRMHSKTKGDVYVAKADVRLYEISQQEGIKVSSLMKMNGFTSENELIKKGQTVLLR
jgi:LysM repeat protein